MAVKISSPTEFLETLSSYRISRIILTAHELDLFSILSDQSLSSVSVADKAGTDPRATDRLMNALVAIGLLTKSESLFRNTDFSAQFLVRNSPAFLGNLSHQVHLWKTWSTLTDAVKKGTSVTIRETFGERDETWLNSFIAAMHSRTQQAAEVAKELNLKGVRQMLDIGGGSGAFTFAFIRENPGIKGIVFDLPAVIQITQKYIGKEGFSGSVTTLGGDYLSDDFGKGFDLILISAVIHINSQEENRELIRKSAEALNAGGQLVILDHIMDDDRVKPEVGAIFAINMLVGTEKGDTYTEKEITEWMTVAGLRNIHYKKTRLATQLLIGTK
jgi:cyclopropane fatty-acyl-phospholipid synthase-like methyltransferase